MTRALIADPEIAGKKGQRGPADDVRVCVGAAEGLYRTPAAGQGDHLRAKPGHRPRGRADGDPPGVGPRRRVVVVGGGVAGLEAARVAALRGHQTILLEATRLSAARSLPSRARPSARTMRRSGMARQLGEEAGVEIRLDTPASGADVLALKPDAVIPRHRRHPAPADIPGVTLPHVATTVDVLTGRAATGRRVVIVDEEGYFRGADDGGLPAERGAQVTIVCRTSWSARTSTRARAPISTRGCSRAA